MFNRFKRLFCSHKFDQHLIRTAFGVPMIEKTCISCGKTIIRKCEEFKDTKLARTLYKN